MFERFTTTSRRAVVLAQEECRLGKDDKIDVEWVMRGCILAAEPEIVWAATADGSIVDRPQRSEASPSGHIPFTRDAKLALEASLAVMVQEDRQYIGVRQIARGIVQMAATNPEIAALIDRYGWEPDDTKWAPAATQAALVADPPGHGDFSIGSRTYPGVAKTIEEIGELQVVLGKMQQTLGKLIGTHGESDHWDGTNLRELFENEAGDVLGAISFVASMNGFDPDKIERRSQAKAAQFAVWQAEQGPGTVAPVA